MKGFFGVYLVFFFSVCGQCIGQANEPEEPLLQKELEAMLVTDQETRSKIKEASEKYGHDSSEVKALWEIQRSIDLQNIQRLEEIIFEFGWPGKSMVGNRGATAAFLVLQHSDLEYQEKYIDMVIEAADKEELKWSAVALLEDRILVRQGKKQKYGSQLRYAPDGTKYLLPVEDEDNLDKRRAAVGLPPIVEYLERTGAKYKTPDSTE